jgi:anaerobic selenocysteine-containing dehydrogenase
VSTEHRTYCPICIARCGVVVTTADGRVSNVRGDEEHPVSKGYTCPKGRNLGAIYGEHPGRLGVPELRHGGGLSPTSWDACLADLGRVLRDVRDESGPNAIGSFFGTASFFDTSGRAAAESLFGQLGTRSRYGAGTVDCACKMLVPGLVTGTDFLNFVPDIERCACIIFFGMNPIVSHGHINNFPNPVVMLREVKARGGEIWSVDPCRTETAALATGHLALRPGSDYAVLAFLVRSLLEEGGADWDYLDRHADHVEELRAAVAPFDLARAVDHTGLPAAQLLDLLASVRRAGRVAALTGTGVTMSHAANTVEWLVWALGIVTGSFDRSGGMVFASGYLSGLERYPALPPSIPNDGGPPSWPDLPRLVGEYPCSALAGEIEAGNLRALVVVGGNPAMSVGDPERLRRAFARLDALVVIDIERTETARGATHVLPAYGYLERPESMLFIDLFHTTRATQLGAKVLEPSGDRRAMWWIIGKVAGELGIDVLPEGLDFDSSDEAVLAANVGRERLVELARHPSGVVAEPPVLFDWVVGRKLPRERFDAAPAALVRQLDALAARAVVPNALVMLPQRQPRHMNTMFSPTGRRDAADATFNPVDAERLGIDDGSVVHITSGAGAITTTARVAERQARGTVSFPHGHETRNVGVLVTARDRVDPVSGMMLQSGIPIEVSVVQPTVIGRR